MARSIALDEPASSPRALHRALVRALSRIALLPLVTLGCASAGSAPPHSAVAPTNRTVVRDQDSKSLENLFAGRFAGVSVTRAAGGGVNVRIRGGANSFLGSNEPLYVVDGTPLPSGTGGIVFLNPYDIETIEVLKNPVDVGIYGIRGANGVVKITTKRPGGRR
jgi:TonB-dependent starch-binding outer membrane protein SusC